MRKILFCTIILTSISLSVIAQTQQQGYVKTRGRLAADGKSVIEGVRLSNALVTIENLSTVKSGEKGIFSFALPAGTNRYRVQSVELKGYILADPDALRQQHAYSKDLPLIVVLEDRAQREADLEAARKSVRNTMKREIRKKQDELDSLREVNAITQAKYDSLMRDFWEYRQSSESLVNEMAERYVSTDYDQLDDFNRQVQAYIESGQLTKADSMIRSKGSLTERYNRVKHAEAANTQREQEIRKEQETLDKSLQFTQKEKDDLSNDLYRQHLIFLQQPLMQDSALLCLKLRADLDTINIDAAFDYAYLSHMQKYFLEAEKYYLIYLKSNTIQSEMFDLAVVQNNLGALYSDLNDYAASEMYYKQALENKEKLYVANPEVYRADLASTQNNLGTLYRDLHYYVVSEKYYKQALENYKILYASSPEAFRSDLATVQNNIGALFCDIHDYAASEKYYKMALKNREKLYATNPETYCNDLAVTQNNLGILYCDLHDYTESEKYYKLALENREKLYTANPEAYRVDLASTQNNLGSLYRNLCDYVISEKYYKLALENREILYAASPEVYRADLAMTQHNLGLLYRDLHNYDVSEWYYKQALENWEKLYAVNPEAYRGDLASTQNSLGILYNDLHDYASSEEYYKQALENKEKLYATNPEAYRVSLAATQDNLGILYSDLQDYAASELYFIQALENREKLYANNPETYRASLASTQNNLGNLYRNLHDYAASEKYYKQALENKERLYVANSEIYLPDLAYTQLNLGNLYRDFHNYDSSERYYKQAIENIEKLHVVNPGDYIETLAMTYWYMILLYSDTKDWGNYDRYLSKSLELYSILYSSDTSAYKEDIVDLQNRMILRLNIKAKQYVKKLDYSNAISTIDEAITIKPQNAKLYDFKGEVLLLQGKEQEALQMWNKILELNPNFLNNYPEGTKLYNGLKTRGLIK